MNVRRRQAVDSALRGAIVALVAGLISFGSGSPLLPVFATTIAVGVVTGLLTYFHRSPREIEAERRFRNAETAVDKLDRHHRRERRAYQTGTMLNRGDDDY